MIEAFYHKLAIPDACFLGKRIYKKLFYENVSLNSTDKKAFSEDIEEIQWRYTLKPETINIARFQDDEREYDEVAILQVTLKSPKHYKRIAQVIQKGIPYPVWLIFLDGTRLAFSLADKRINRADRDKIRVEAFYETDWMNLENLSEIEQAFIEQCVITRFSYQHFYAFYVDLTARVIALQCAYLNGNYALENDLTRQQRLELLNSIRHKQQHLTELRSALKKENPFNQKVQLNIKIKQQERQLQQQLQQL